MRLIAPPECGEAALKNRIRQFVIDGEAVILGVDGISDFNALHSGTRVQLCAFDVLAMDGDDLRRLPLSMRKANLARLLARRPEGIFLSPFEQGEIGPDCLRVRARGPCLEASRPALSRRQVKALDQSEEPEASRFRSGARSSQANDEPLAPAIVTEHYEPRGVDFEVPRNHPRPHRGRFWIRI